jgi:hypothetical protein
MALAMVVLDRKDNATCPFASSILHPKHHHKGSLGDESMEIFKKKQRCIFKNRRGILLQKKKSRLGAKRKAARASTLLLPEGAIKLTCWWWW